MKISKDGFVFKVAYGFKEPHERPRQANLCPLFWRFIVFLLLVWPLYLFVGKPIKWFLIVFGFVFGFPFGYRPAIFKKDKEDHYGDLVVPYERWPVLFGSRIALPFWFIIVFAVSFSSFLSYHFFQKADYPSFGIFGGLSILYVIIGFSILFPKKGSGTIGMVSAYLKAKKEKICPTVIFID